MKNILRPALVLALAFTAACDDSPTGSDYPSGSLSFSYASEASGLTGTFTASGAISPGAENETWAAAVRESGDAAVAANLMSGSVESTALVSLPNVHTGATPITEECDTMCPSVSFVITKAVGNATRTYMCDMVTGTINVGTLTNTRIKGTFSGNGVCFSLEDENEPAISINNGTFDTPVVSSPVIGDL